MQGGGHEKNESFQWVWKSLTGLNQIKGDDNA